MGRLATALIVVSSGLVSDAQGQGSNCKQHTEVCTLLQIFDFLHVHRFTQQHKLFTHL